MMQVPAQARNPTAGDLIELAKNPKKYEAIETQLREMTREADLAFAKLQIGEATQQALDSARQELAEAQVQAQKIKQQAESDAAKIISEAESKAEARENALVQAQTELDAQKSEFETQRRATERRLGERGRLLETRETEIAEKTEAANANFAKSERARQAGEAMRRHIDAGLQEISEAAK